LQHDFQSRRCISHQPFLSDSGPFYDQLELLPLYHRTGLDKGIFEDRQGRVIMAITMPNSDVQDDFNLTRRLIG
jgi:hypothetical protein